MELHKWKLQEELKELCINCVGLKPSTAKKYAQNLFNKFSDDDGCISNHSSNDYFKIHTKKEDLLKALYVLKTGIITSSSSVLKIEDISYVDFQEKAIEITTKNGKVIRYNECFEYLKYVFKDLYY